MTELAAGPSANSDLLWSPERLRSQLGAPGLSIIDTRQAELFAAGRIAGARHFDPYFINCDDTDAQPLASFTRMGANLIGWRGAKQSDTIVFYGAFTDMCAARCFWLAEYLGHDRAHVLDGGMTAWRAAGLPIELESKPPHADQVRVRGGAGARCNLCRRAAGDRHAGQRDPRQSQRS